VVTTPSCACFHFSHARAMGAGGATPAFPCRPSVFGGTRFTHKLGRYLRCERARELCYSVHSRDGPKDQTRNLEISGLDASHCPGMTIHACLKFESECLIPWAEHDRRPYQPVISRHEGYDQSVGETAFCRAGGWPTNCSKPTLTMSNAGFGSRDQCAPSEKQFDLDLIGFPIGTSPGSGNAGAKQRFGRQEGHRRGFLPDKRPVFRRAAATKALRKRIVRHDVGVVGSHALGQQNVC